MKKLYKSIIVTLLVLVLTCLLVKPALNNINFGIDLQGGFEVLYKISPLKEGEEITKDDLDNTYKAIVNRIDSIGVSEPVIEFEGNNLLRVQLPGVSNEEEARNRISTTAVLSFRDVNDNLLMNSDILGRNGARVSQNSKTLAYQVALDIKDTSTFYDVTKDISNRSNGENRIVIWLDFDKDNDSFKEEESKCGQDGNMKCISSAYVNEAFSSDVVIEGGFSKEQAEYLASLINSGSLPTKLTEEATPRSVSASFGEDTIYKTSMAGIIAFVLISLILIVKYRFSGIIGSICLFVYATLVFVLFNSVGGVLTLTGIAALILGVGMAVDSTIISNDRVKDELRNGKSLINAYKEGSKSSLVAIIDANITTFIAAIILYIFGESTVRGFATMLMITIFVTIMCSVILYRILTSMFVKSRYFDNKEVLFIGKIHNKTNYNFMKLSKKAIFTSLSVLVIGIIFLFINGINFGVDFTGGTNITISSEKTLDLDSVKKELSSYDITDSGKYIGSKNEGYIKLNNVLSNSEIIKIKENLGNKGYDVSVNEISNLVTKNLTTNAVKSLIYSIVAIILYMIIRFDFSYAVSGILMLLHDVLITLAVFIIFNIRVEFILVAAILTIIGYSINDTIVVFDRIRENTKKLFKNKKKLTKEDLITLVNTSSNETVSRNLWTSITTIVSIVTLLFVNLNSIFTFNIAILIGLIAGTMSSLLIAPRVWLFFKNKSLNKKEEDDNEAHELLVKGVNS